MNDSEIWIERVEVDASGRGPWRRKEAVVRGALAGERVAVSWDHVGGRRAFGRLRGVLRSAPERVPVRCRHFLRCGGCDLLHATRDHQLLLKQQWLKTMLGREVEPVEAAEAGFGYRALAKFVVGPTGTLGSYAPRSHQVVSMDGCLVHMPVIEEVADGLRALWAESGRPDLRFVVIRASRDGAGFGVSLVAPAGPEKGPALDRTDLGPALDRTVGLLAEDPRTCWVELRHERQPDDVILDPGDPRRRLVQRRPLIERIGPVELVLEPDGFSQVHPAMAGRLFAHAVAELGPKDRAVADLYAGAAVLGRWALTEGAATVVAVEPTPGPTPALAGLQTVEARTEDAFDAWKDATHVFVNPPRRGLGSEVVARLAGGAAERLVYVSCGPEALARDLEGLARAFEVERIRPFDLFPQTRHVESVVTLQRR